MSLLSYWPQIAGSAFALAWMATSLTGLDKNDSKVIKGMFGAPKGVLDKPGLNVTLPWPFTRTHADVSLKKHIMHDDLYAKTKNNVPLTIPIDTEFRVVDSEKFAYASEDPIETVKQKVSRAVKSEVNELDYDEVASEKDEIMTRVKAALDDELLAEYGIELIDVLVDEPVPDSKIEEALTRREAAKLAEDAGVREGNAESLRIVELANGLIKGAEELKNKARDAGYGDSATVIALAQRHIALTDASKGDGGNLILDIGGGESSTSARALAAGLAANDRVRNFRMPEEAPAPA